MSEIGASFLRKTRSEIQNVPIVDGQLIFETDQENNSKIYTDIGTDRIAIGGKTDVVDVLNSTSVVDALSANKGKELNDAIENIVDGTTAVGEAEHADNGFKLYTQSGGTLSGDGNFGYFTASGSGTYNTLTIGGSSLAVKCGEETEIELVDGVMYQFIIDDASGTINFKPASGLKLKVVGGTTRPTNPVANTIWIKTNVALSGVFSIGSTVLPGSANNGDVYFFNDSVCGQQVEYVIGKTTMKLGLSYTVIRSGGAWIRVPVQVYKNSQWVEVGVTLIRGQFVSPIYGEFFQSSENTSSMPSKANYGISFFETYDAWSRGYFTSKINLSTYSKIVFTSVYTDRGNSYLTAYINNTADTSSPVKTQNILTSATGVNVKYNNTVDVASIGSSYYVVIQKNGGNQWGERPWVYSMVLY